MSKKLNYDELYKKYGKYVYRIALKYANRDTELAKDMTQDTFVELYVQIDTMHQSNMRSWLYTTVKNRIINEKKRQNRVVLESYMEHPEQMNLEVADPQELETEYIKVEGDRENRYLVNEIFDAMYEKNPRWYTAMDLRYRRNMPRVIVADEMGVTIGVLDSILSRAKEWVRKEFGITLKETRQN